MSKSKYVKILGDAASSAVPGHTALVSTHPSLSVELADLKQNILPGVAGAAVGSYLWKRHRVLGALTGLGIGSNGRDLLSGDRKKAALSIGVSAAGAVGSLYWKRHPVWGWIAGTVLAGVAASFIPGSREYEMEHFSTK